jgi:hypothetical protein
MSTAEPRHDEESAALALGMTLLGATSQDAQGSTRANVEARLGGIEVLREACERWPVRRRMIGRFLCAYVRERAGWTDALPPTRPADLIPSDVQAALDVFVELDPDDRAVADLVRTDLRAARLWGARLDGAELMRAHLELADLGEASLRGANLSGANLEGAILYRADLTGARLWSSSLRRTTLREANLLNADLSHVDLSESVLSGANLEGVNLVGARIAGARFEGVTGVSSDNVEWLMKTAALTPPSMTPAG